MNKIKNIINHVWYKWKSIESDRKLAWYAGLGLILFCLHNPTLTYHTGDRVAIWLPQWGELLFGAVIVRLWVGNRLSLGPRIIWVPLAIIAALIIIRTCLTAIQGHNEAPTEALLAIILFGAYTAARTLGPRMFEPCVIFVPILAASTVIYSLVQIPSDSGPNYTNGGLVSWTNYTGGAELLALGCMAGVVCLSNRWHRAVFVGIAAIGIVFTGAPEGIVALGLVGMYMIILEWRSRRLWAVIGVVVVVCSIWLGTGYGMKQQHRTIEVTQAAIRGDYNGDDRDDSTGWGTGRYPAYKRAIYDIKVLGHDYDIYNYQTETGDVIAHQIPLVILDQIGPLGALAWLFVTIYLFIKSRWHYLWLAFLSYCLFDHLLWTCYAPWWWVIVGVTSAWILDYKGRIYDVEGIQEQDKRAEAAGQLTWSY